MFYVLLWAVVGGAILSMGAGLFLLFRRPRDRRPAMLPALIPLTFMGPMLGLAATGRLLLRGFAEAARAGGVESMAEVCLRASQLLLAGAACAATALGLVALLALAGSAGGSAAAPSFRRQAVLALLPVVAACSCGAAFEYGRRTVDIAAIVVCADDGRPEDLARSARYPVLGSPGSAGIAEISQRVALGANAGVFGGAYLLVVLLGLAAAGIAVAWPASGSRSLTAYTLALALAAGGVSGLWAWRISTDARWIEERMQSTGPSETSSRKPAPSGIVGGRGAQSLKLTVTVMITGTGTPSSSVGVYSHWLTASRAA